MQRESLRAPPELLAPAREDLWLRPLGTLLVAEFTLVAS
jgi:hypothetical protein